MSQDDITRVIKGVLNTQLEWYGKAPMFHQQHGTVPYLLPFVVAITNLYQICLMHNGMSENEVFHIDRGFQDTIISSALLECFPGSARAIDEVLASLD